GTRTTTPSARPSPTWRRRTTATTTPVTASEGREVGDDARASTARRPGRCGHGGGAAARRRPRGLVLRGRERRQARCGRRRSRAGADRALGGGGRQRGAGARPGGVRARRSLRRPRADAARARLRPALAGDRRPLVRLAAGASA